MSSKEQRKINDTENESDSVCGPSSYNSMCLNYFSYMGYGEICSQFSKEINFTPEFSYLLERRTKIRRMIEQGKIDEVFSEINDINIELIDKNYYLYYILIQHKAYEKASQIHLMKDLDEDTKVEKIIEVLEYVREELTQVVKDHPDLNPLLEDFLEFLIFNSWNISIKEKRSELADTINRIILEKYNVGVNELEKVIKGILNEESTLSKTNKFKGFKDVILDN